MWTLCVHGCISTKNEYSTVNTGSTLERVRTRVYAEIEKGEQGGSAACFGRGRSPVTCADINVAPVERDIVYDITSVIPVKCPASSGVP